MSSPRRNPSRRSSRRNRSQGVPWMPGFPQPPTPPPLLPSISSLASLRGRLRGRRDRSAEDNWYSRAAAQLREESAERRARDAPNWPESQVGSNQSPTDARDLARGSSHVPLYPEMMDETNIHLSSSRHWPPWSRGSRLSQSDLPDHDGQSQARSAESLMLPPRLSTSASRPHRQQHGDQDSSHAASPYQFSSSDLSLHDSMMRAHVIGARGPLPPPITALGPGPSRQHHSDQDSNVDRGNKRRKLDANRIGSVLRGLQYGRFGQVEAGQLRMEISSCDGGIYSRTSRYVVENILKDDYSVYCTKGRRCNIVLQHQGSSVFTLRELVIKAPASVNFTNPLKEGMVFVSMDKDDESWQRTLLHQIQYTTSPIPREVPEIISIRHNQDGTTTTTRSYQHPFIEGLECLYEDSQCARLGPSSQMAIMPDEFEDIQPGFRVITEYKMNEEDINGDFREPPNRIGLLPFENDAAQADRNLAPEPLFNPSIAPDFEREFSHFTAGGVRRDPSEVTAPEATGSDNSLRQYHHAATPNSTSQPSSLRPQSRSSRRRHQTPSIYSHSTTTTTNTNLNNNIDDQSRDGNSISHSRRSSSVSLPEPIETGQVKLLSPHARFSMGTRKNRCTIRFEPPITGRYLLLKFWNTRPQPPGNIDIQSVIARGFSGPRYFPSIKLS